MSTSHGADKLILGVGQCVCPPWFTKEKRACQICLGLPERRYPPILMVMNIRLKIPSRFIFLMEFQSNSLKTTLFNSLMDDVWGSPKIAPLGKSDSHLHQGSWFCRGMQSFPSLAIIRLSSMTQLSSFHDFDWKTFEVNLVLAPQSLQNSWTF